MTAVKEKNKTLGESLNAARRLAPEDVRVGDDVAIVEITYQVPSFLWCGADAVTMPPERPVRMTYLHAMDQGPLRVESVCLPFVLCQPMKGRGRVLDVRQVQLARLDACFADQVRSAQKSKKSRKKKSRKKKH